jgi:hypothetical protein
MNFYSQRRIETRPPVIISQAELQLILNPKIRKRSLSLPVKRGSLGELKKCPAKPGGVHRLKARVPYERFRQQAEAQPTRARAVLELIERCDRPTAGVTVTVRTVAREFKDGKDVWTIGFEKGDHASVLDRPLFLAKSGDYTFAASRQSVPGDPEVLMPLAADLEKARRRARDEQVTPQVKHVRHVAGQMNELQKSMRSMKHRDLARRAQRTLQTLERLLLTEDGVDSRVAPAADGSQGEEERPHHTGAATALEAA